LNKPLTQNPPASGEVSAVDFYRERIGQLGYSYQAQWGDDSPWKWETRFAPLRLLPFVPGQTVCDIGCGTGELAMWLRHTLPGVTYLGVDIVPEFVEEAKTRTGEQVIVGDAFCDPSILPAADWYVTFGTLNKEWCLSGLPGATFRDKIGRYLDLLFERARVGVAVTLVTSIVDYHKPGVCNMSPVDVTTQFASLTPHFLIYHGYSFFEFFCSAWRGARR
jgi:SAM-dependent methyltransferase